MDVTRRQLLSLVGGGGAVVASRTLLTGVDDQPVSITQTNGVTPLSVTGVTATQQPHAATIVETELQNTTDRPIAARVTASWYDDADGSLLSLDAHDVPSVHRSEPATVGPNEHCTLSIRLPRRLGGATTIRVRVTPHRGPKPASDG